MNYGKEFKKFATKGHGVNSLYYDKIVGALTPKNMTPYIIEERQLNISQLDVFSQLMTKLLTLFKHSCCSLKVLMLQKTFRFI